jgi:hypothetical protein
MRNIGSDDLLHGGCVGQVQKDRICDRPDPATLTTSEWLADGTSSRGIHAGHPEPNTNCIFDSELSGDTKSASRVSRHCSPSSTKTASAEARARRPAPFA